MYILKILLPLQPVQRGWGGGGATYFHGGPLQITKMGRFMNDNTFSRFLGSVNMNLMLQSSMIYIYIICKFGMD